MFVGSFTRELRGLWGFGVTNDIISGFHSSNMPERRTPGSVRRQVRHSVRIPTLAWDYAPKIQIIGSLHEHIPKVPADWSNLFDENALAFLEFRFVVAKKAN